MLVIKLKWGEKIEFGLQRHGDLGTVRLEKVDEGAYGHKARLVFDMPRDFLIRRMMDHQQSKTSFGLTGEPRGPVCTSAA
jgi:hypothetical protein